MKISQDELADILSQTTTFLGELLASNAELRETMLDQHQTDAQQDKIERVKRELEDEKTELKRLRHRQEHKRNLERLRKDRTKHRQQENKGSLHVVPLRNARGQLIGWVQPTGGGRVNIRDANGRLVATEVNGVTLDRFGRVAGKGRLGLVLLGRELPRNRF